jgi:cytoskeletal protein CcmA (bactofilin family)
MFGNKPVEAAPTVIGRGAVIEGTIRASGRVQVDGEIEGTLEVDGHVSIGPDGRVKGELTADDVAVGGEVEGRLTARNHLHLVASGRVRGDVRYDTLQVDKGGLLDGRTVHGDDADMTEVDAEIEADVEPAKSPAPPEPPSRKLNGRRASQAPAPIGVG